MNTLVIRADASSQIGIGHVMRCLAIAQAWLDCGGAVTFVSCQLPTTVKERIRAEGAEVVEISCAAGSGRDAEQVVDLAQGRKAEWVVVDGYEFGLDYQTNLRSSGLKLLFLDDYGHANGYCADLVLNYNAYASPDSYQQLGSQTRLLLGPRYVLLRREFNAWRGWKRETVRAASKVLVTLGGSDAHHVARVVIQALAISQVRVDGFEAKVVLGSEAARRAELQPDLSACEGAISLTYNADNMPELMAWADVAISSAGSTVWELCFLGLPAILVDLVPHQRLVAETLERLSIAVHLDSSHDLLPGLIASKLELLVQSLERRATMSQRGRELVDGRGAERVVAAIRAGTLRLRRAEETDCRLLWEWANDPEVRGVSFSSDPIPWEQHVTWFKSKLADPNAVLYLATDSENVPVGQVRYQITNPEAVVSIDLAAGFRGKGLGGIALSIATGELFRTTQVSSIHAYVKPGNEASLRLFGNAQFSRRGVETIRGRSAVHFVLERKAGS
jgi:UDP-2,4-diacetamido-2,4,6-trideoxy-beta-L-altropyranose hydrolase